MDQTTLEIFGLIAGAITSLGFLPQLFRGYRTKKLDDVSYFMPGILAIGMTMWIVYGFLIEAMAVIIANFFGVMCCLVLIFLKKRYA